MSQTTKRRWERMRTDETRKVEEVLRKHFPGTDAYRYNSASIRVRVIDERFEGKSLPRRDSMVEKYLKELPRETQADIINLVTLAPSEAADFSSRALDNNEFDDPSPSVL